MTIYGYCRISRRSQNIERQIRNIKNSYPMAVIVQEAYTGTTIERPRFNKLLKALRTGDVLVFDSVSRMSRNAEEGYELYEKLFNDGIDMVFLKEPHINTDTYKQAIQRKVEMTGDDVDLILEGINRYLLRLASKQIQLAFEQSQKEVDDLHQRTSEGLKTAALNGKRVGARKGDKYITKKHVTALKIIQEHCKEFGGNLKDTEVIKLCGCTKKTFYKYKAQALGNK